MSIVSAGPNRDDFYINVDSADNENFSAREDNSLCKRVCEVAYSAFTDIKALVYAVIKGRDKALEFAVFNESSRYSPKILTCLGADPNQIKTKPLYGPLLDHAIREEKPSSVKKLLDCGAPIDGPSDGLTSPLCIACYRNSPQMVEFLLEHGANPNAIDGLADDSAFETAIANGYTEIAELLIRHGLGIHTDARQMDLPPWMHLKTPLCFASHHGRIKIVHLLLDSGVDVNVENSNGSNALMEAVLAQHKETAILLIERGADLHKTLRAIEDEEHILFLKNVINETSRKKIDQKKMQMFLMGETTPESPLYRFLTSPTFDKNLVYNEAAQSIFQYVDSIMVDGDELSKGEVLQLLDNL